MTDPRPARLATVAMLMTNYDAGRDHLSMFEPFVLGAVTQSVTNDVDPEQIAKDVGRLYDLSMPANAVRTILARLQKRGYLTREGGRFFRTGARTETAPIDEQRHAVEQSQHQLGHALLQALIDRDDCPDDTDAALVVIARVLDALHVSLAVGEPVMTDANPFHGHDAPLLIATARFLEETASVPSAHGETLLAMVQGYVLQKTLLLTDVSLANRRFKNLRVIADSQLLFGMVGLLGSAMEASALEFLTVLKETGAFVEALDITIAEMRRVLLVFEDHLATQHGRETLRPTQMTRAVLDLRLSASDIRLRASMLERDLRKLGIEVREPPSRESKWTGDEQALSQALAEYPGDSASRRVVHDVDCVAAVLTHRQGRTSLSLESAETVFVTTSGLTVKNTIDWYRKTGGVGIPPIVHYIAISNAAWLKKPSAATRLKLHELIALCSAALRPSLAAWNCFVRHLTDLRESGRISSDEETAVIVSELTDKFIVDEQLDDDMDANSVAEVVARVKARYSDEASAQVESARQDALNTIARAARITNRLTTRGRRVGRWTSTLLAAALGVSFVAGAIGSVVQGIVGSAPPWPFIALAVVPAGLFSLAAGVWGISIKSLRQDLDDRISGATTRWLLGSETDLEQLDTSGGDLAEPEEPK